MSNLFLNKKKGQIVLGFLVKMLITILIIFSSVAMIGKIFSVLVDQSGDNFVDFVSDMNYVSDHGNGYKMSSMLIMDEDSAVVYFSGNKNTVLKIKYYGNYYDLDLIFSPPESCPKEGSCICLMQTLSGEKSGEKEANRVEVVAGKVRCVELDYELSISSCSIGKPKGIESLSYNCQNGFVIERNIVRTNKWIGDGVSKSEFPYFYNERRGSFLLVNEGGVVNIIPNLVYTYTGPEHTVEYIENLYYASGGDDPNLI